MKKLMKKIVLIVCPAVLLAACATKFKEEAQEIEAMPINCATAEGDIRVLQSEKANLAEQVAMGATAIAPAGLVMGLVTGTEKEKLNVAAGDYNKMINDKIAEIRATCGL